MDDRKIQIFLAVIEYGSFSKASEHLHCTQSAVTQAINRLEKELGCTLLTRYHSGVKLTTAGEMLLPYLKSTLDEMTKLQNRARELSSETRSILRIGAFSSIANTWLPKIIRSYRDSHPEMVFDIKISTGDLEHQVLSNQIDIAFGDHLRLSRLEFIPLMEDIYFAVLPEDIKKGKLSVTQQELSELPFLMAPMNELEHILSVTPKNTVRVDCDDDITLLNMVASGLGSTVMPQLSLQTVPDGVTILPLLPEISRTLGIGINAEAPVQARQFCKYVSQVLFTKSL